MKSKTLFTCHAAIIAAMYVALALISTAFGMSSGVIQCRLSEALCILPIFTPAAVPGVTVGCLITNLVSGCNWLDILFGTAATLLGALGTRALRKFRILAPFPPIVANTLIIPFVLKYAYNVGDALPFIFVTVGAGEIISAGLFGYILMAAVWPIRTKLFGREQ